MALHRNLLLHILCFTLIPFVGYNQSIGFKNQLKESPNELTVFCIPNNEHNKKTLANNDVLAKFSSENWIFINSTPAWINEHKNDGSITDFYFEFAPPVQLADTARAWHNVDEVHSGMLPLESAYTGTDVIIGVVDQGLDLTHPDFLDANGDTRVMRYWDHSMVSGPNSPAPYGYGQLWDSTAINNGTCTSTENQPTAHGTSVAGIAVGNANANGANKGMAPDANIVIVETNFGLSNWTLTIADAVDYIFKVADTLGMPAVVNLSLGTYYGSHDGNDPASEYIETLLDEKPGRIVVCAAGNSGAQGSYHQQSNVTSDTNFVWFVDNPSSQFGANTIFFDLWSDTPDATFDFAFGADEPTNFSFRGRTGFHGASSSIGTNILDTIWNGPNRIATIDVFTEIIGNAYHMEFLATLDTLNYNYRFETKGTGQYDLWSGAWAGINNMVTTLPTAVQMPDIVKYKMPDTDQTIVSSWNCSEKVISVGNFRNRLGHIDKNLNPYVNAATTPGDISPNSSLGPNRHNITKPDVTASGDVSLSAGPDWLINNTNPAYFSLIDSGGWHVRNGGTSMASPIIAGIAALYLDRCRYATYDQFRTDLHNTAYSDGFTGIVPNNTYGHGKGDAFALLQELTLANQPSISYNSGTTILSTVESGYQWVLDGALIPNETNQEHTPIPPYGSYTVLGINSDGCFSESDPLVIAAYVNEYNEYFIQISPNPASNEIQLKTELNVIKVEAIDLTGKIIELDGMNNTYDVSKLSKGTFIIKIHTDSGLYHSKLVHL